MPDGEFPAMVKPRRGAGGWRNAIVPDIQGLADWEALYPDVPYIRQEPVEGIPASVCCITNGSRACAIAANEQILQGNGDSAFGFCGSVTPLEHPLRQRMMVIAEQIAAASGCTGTIGVDFVLGTSQPYAIEVNPRFQGTVDTIEMAYDCNLFQLHVNTCAGSLPSSLLREKQFAVRSILFADQDMTISADLKSCKNFLADIPYPGTSFDAGQAVVSVFGWGGTRGAAFCLLDKHISSVTQYIR
jgi:predicted ATP-grasp superfamily ATP-dependent carboligase